MVKIRAAEAGPQNLKAKLKLEDQANNNRSNRKQLSNTKSSAFTL